MKRTVLFLNPRILAAPLAMLLLEAPVTAQVLDTFQPTINSSFGLPYARVMQFAVQPDGRILLGGQFTELNGVNSRHLGRVRADGGLDAAFQPSTMLNGVAMLALLGDGKFIAASGGTDPVTRYLPDGNRDYSYPSGVSDGNFGGMAAFPDGKLAFDNQVGPGVGTIRMVNASGIRLYDVPILGAAGALAAQLDGKLLVGGQFTSLAGQSRTNLARLNTNGALDPNFNPDVTGNIWTLALQPDGKILIGGNFVVEGQSRSLARLNSAGALDTSFNPVFSGTVRSLALQADGKVIVAGNVSGCPGGTCANVARFDSTGAYDPSFAPVPDDMVQGVAIQPDGAVLLGGDFTWVTGQPRVKIARLLNTEPATQSLSIGGSVITWLRGGTSPEVWTTTFESSANGTNWTLLGPGTRIAGGWQLTGVTVGAGTCVRARGYITGGFANSSAWFAETVVGAPILITQPESQTNVFGTTASFHVDCVGSNPFTYQWRKNGVGLSDSGDISGTQDSTLTIANVAGDDSGAFSVVVSNPSGSITSVVANLTVLDPAILNRPWPSVVALGDPLELSVEATGTPPLAYVWTRNGVVLTGATSSILNVAASAQLSDTGDYNVTVSNQYGSQSLEPIKVRVTPNYADEFNPSLTLDGPPGTPPAVQALAVQTDGKILIGGAFTMAGGGLSPGFARLEPDGTLDPSLQFGMDSTVMAALVLPDSKILASTSYGFSQSTFLFRFLPGGGLDPTFDLPPNSIWDSPFPIVRQPDGTAVFRLSAGPTSLLERLDADGSLDTNYQAEVYEIVNALAVQPDGKVLIGGLVYQIGNHPVKGLGRFNADGSPDTTFSPEFSLDGDWTQAYIESIAVQEDGKILVTGIFNEVAGKACEGIIRLNPDGTADPGFIAALPYRNGLNVFSIALQADGKILLGGDFSSLNGQPISRIGRLNPDGSLDPSFNPGADGGVWALTLQPDGRVLVGGWYFTTVGGKPRNGLARLVNTDPAVQTLTYDGSKVRWLRGGTAPAILTASFERSADGLNWTSLGQGTRINGGWESTNTTLTVGTRLRARGWVAGGYAGSSGWMVESTATVGMQILSGTLQKSPFAFTLAGVAGQTVVIEGSTNLQNWIPLKTNLVPGNGLVPFSDPDSAVYPKRFYRGRVQ